jgi:hypothetical protein
MRLADGTFRDVSGFLAAMSRWMGTHTDWAYRLSERLTDVPTENREQFRALIGNPSQRRGIITSQPSTPPAVNAPR